MSTIERASAIAEQAHADQVDKGGAPYITHPTRVALAVDGDEAKIVALLHDVVEDSEWTLDQLRDEGFSEAVVEAVDALTHKEREDYFDAVRRAKANPLARIVKLADLADNSDRSRPGETTEQDERRLEKYARARDILLEDK
ncbi:HD domain-containing protein [Aurantimonas aggregata]|uniref:HD domain-containing protein n=1 Tax=Aurantimonas aggregata TaxID=2047720 RepID=A0A6L9MN85_9HYPH|nr:HD domain-containing protein [Aurantimonas aggregata]NDV89424.1 HD domain-containing protein [Aurantimonas aggregata]